jgi:meso-butanediol dehydrogenase/(S,S)-butanediol dehydrogenase/diacetyl reductase
MQRLVDRIALITGAASGIGYATAERCIAEGATVVLTDISNESLASSYAALCGAGSPHRAVRLDVTAEEHWIRAIKEVDAAYGRLDVLVNNAGCGMPRYIEECTLQEWRTCMAGNLDSVFLGTKYSLPLLARSGHGSIVNVASIMGLVGGVRVGPYTAAKAGVRGFTKATAIECAAARNGVRANSVHPGQIRTPLFMRGNDEARVREVASQIPMGRVGDPREIADVIVFLASDESSFMTGTELVVDGGLTSARWTNLAPPKLDK